MAKKKIEIEEVPVLTEEENEKKPIWYRTGIWASVTAIAGVAAAALYEIYKSSKESPEPSVDLFKAPVQPIIPHVEAEVVEEPVKEEPKKEEPKIEEAPKVEETPKAEPKKTAPATGGKYVANGKTMVYHTLDCRYGKRISAENKVFLKTKNAATRGGYEPCSFCNP